MTSAAKIVALLLITVFPAALLAQSKKNTKTRQKPVTSEVTAQPTPAPTPDPQKTPTQKRNERPNDPTSNSDHTKPAQAQSPSYFYQFERPGFTYPSISIEHDEAGRGQIAFVKTGNDVAVADPVLLSPVTLARLKDAFTALNFFDSTEIYQTPRDYSTMGNVTITLRRDGRSRTAKYNWTENKNARSLADEYRRISNEYIWRFELALARDNQPLHAPALMDQMDDYLKRGEISDPLQMLTILRDLGNDERIPLIARNHAAKMASRIEKSMPKPPR